MRLRTNWAACRDLPNAGLDLQDLRLDLWVHVDMKLIHIQFPTLSSLRGLELQFQILGILIIDATLIFLCLPKKGQEQEEQEPEDDEGKIPARTMNGRRIEETEHAGVQGGPVSLRGPGHIYKSDGAPDVLNMHEKEGSSRACSELA